MISGIYQIRNTVSGRRYVGSTSNFIRRKSQHFTQLRNNIHCNEQLLRAFAKYGEEALVFEILEELPQEELIKVEQEYIDNNMGGYNLAKIAGSNADVPRTKEWLRKMSESQKGIPKSEMTKRRLARSKKTKSRLGINKGRITSDSAKALIRAAREKPMYCVETGREYKSRNEVAETHNISTRTIWRSNKNNKPVQSLNMTFKYKV